MILVTFLLYGHLQYIVYFCCSNITVLHRIIPYLFIYLMKQEKFYLFLHPLMHLMIISKIFGGINEAENYFNSIYYTNYHFIQNTNNNPIYSRFADEVLTHWNNKLYPMLKKYARVPLYHPDTIESTMEFLKNS